MSIWLILILAAAYLYYRNKKQKERQMKRDYIDAEAKVILEIPCAVCGKMVEDDFRHCPHCGAKMK